MQSVTMNLLPGYPFQERFIVPRIYSPKRDGKPDPVETCPCNFREVFFSLNAEGY